MSASLGFRSPISRSETTSPHPVRPVFDTELLRAYMKKLLQTTLQHAVWSSDRDQVKSWMKDIKERVKDRMIEIQPTGMKYMVLVQLSENLNQGGRILSFARVSHWPSADEEDELDDQNEGVKEAEKKVGRHEVWRDMLHTSNGRDKAFKLIQYAIRVYLLFHTNVLFRNGGAAWKQALVRRFESARSGLSFTRKMLILFNWLTPLSTIMAQKTVPYSSDSSSLTPHGLADTLAKKPSLSYTGHILSHPFLRALLAAPPPVLLDLVNGLSDDIYTLSRLGLVGSKTGSRAARFADWCWFFGTLVGLVENGVQMGIVDGLQRQVENRAYTESLEGATSKSRPKIAKLDEKELTRLRRESYWLHASQAKLIMDLIFVSYEILRLKRWKNTVQSFTGLAAAVLGSAKLYDKYKSALVSKVLSNTA
ncbi:hypothetical protein PAXINDRAFT_7207 [Paxillus involutus ATCC 200175]|nr:hypothetical protein PAXINDRAFT_7207 [Paxillus involutus ATCC 200175]